MNDSILVRFEQTNRAVIEPMTFQFRPVVGETISYQHKSFEIYKVEHVYSSGSAMVYAKEVDLW